MHLTDEQVEELRNWGDKYPPRAFRWAQYAYPMRVPEYFEGMTENQIKIANRYSPRYRLHYSGTKSNIIGYNKILSIHIKEYSKFLSDNKIEPSFFDKQLRGFK